MKKKIRWLLVAVLLASTFVLTGAAAGKETERIYHKYYVNIEETEVLKTEFEPEDESTEALVREMMTSLNEREFSGKGLGLLPMEVEIQSYKLEEGTLQLTFNNAYSMMGRAREILVRVGVSKSFLQIPEIQAVRFITGKGELTDSKGNPVGDIKKGTFVELEGTDENTYRYDTFTLYFTDEQGKELLPETRNVYYKRSLSRERVILEQLAKGPMEKGHYPTIPNESELLDISIADKVAYAKFNGVFLENALDIEEDVIVYSVVNSLISSLDIEDVQILIEGQKNPVLGDLQLYNFYEWNETLVNRKEQK